MQNVFLPAMNNSMAGVVSALASHHDIGVGREDVDDLPLAFIAPLRADQNRVGHDVSGKILSKNKSDGKPRKTILGMSAD